MDRIIQITEEINIRDEATKDEIFQTSMGKKWTKVQQLYINNKFVPESKLTRSGDTALHIAISYYHPDRDDPKHHPHLTCIKEMIANIPKENRLLILKQKNEKGNTPLHLAAALGSVPIIESLVNSEDPTLIRQTNSKGETPLFIAAYQGKLKAFLYLHKCVQDENGEGPIELCRRGDGDNILHAAISGGYFEVAFQIIHYYPPLVNYYNTEGMSPLHFLSRMPQVFKSGSHFRFLDSIIYYCINIDELKLMTYKPEDKDDSKLKELGRHLPENYQTLVEFLELLQYQTQKFREYIKIKKIGRQGNNSKDTTQATNVNLEEVPRDTTNMNQDKMSQDHQSDCQYDPENPPIECECTCMHILQFKLAKEKMKGKLFSANYSIFIEFLKCLMKIVLVVLGIGLPRIKKLEETKNKNKRGVQIMELMINKEERYKFNKTTGEKPEDRGHDSRVLAPPTEPPLIVEDDDKKDEDQSKTAAIEQSPTSSTELYTPTKETPLLVASRMGIVEMVKKILEKFPIAIQDTDSEKKNLLLLAVEHRQTEVYNWLIGQKYPEHVFYQVDKHGNNAMHLAAMFQNFQVWRIPRSALQLQGERKWYKYVKHTLPPASYVSYNNKGQTPREIFIETHVNLLKDGTEWLIKTANSYSVVATLITTVAFATAATVPGGPDDSGHPHLQNQPAFEVFCISSLVSLCFSVMALVFFLAILTSQCEHKDFETDLPRKLLIALTSLFVSISASLVSFCAAHFFLLGDKFKKVAFLIYGATCIPVVFLAFNQLPLYFDLICSSQELPIRSYKGYKKLYIDSSVASSSDQKKADKDKDD
ncbi:uncharacterized protein LOC132604407 [Lycium barbarum]|uniref:uncharacterized protein LOC132604407 n=1 Tax=Lycium barbarum TaxID=112863 RepID=UPI00293ED07B|nr:uncharacterized protein LOC132604407 [Lycium barbarum]